MSQHPTFADSRFKQPLEVFETLERLLEAFSDFELSPDLPLEASRQYREVPTDRIENKVLKESIDTLTEYLRKAEILWTREVTTSSVREELGDG